MGYAMGADQENRVLGITTATTSSADELVRKSGGENFEVFGRAILNQLITEIADAGTQRQAAC